MMQQTRGPRDEGAWFPGRADQSGLHTQAAHVLRINLQNLFPKIVRSSSQCVTVRVSPGDMTRGKCTCACYWWERFRTD